MMGTLNFGFKYFVFPGIVESGGTCRGGGVGPLPAVRPLMDLELRGEKNARIALNERKPMVPNFRVSSQPMTS